MTQLSRESKGCFTVGQVTLHKVDDIQYQTCVGNFYSSSAMFWVEAEARYNQGVMPFPGSLTEQPQKVLEIFSVISAHKHDKMERQQKSQELVKQNGRSNPHQHRR